MAIPAPDKFKSAKEVSRPVHTFAIAKNGPIAYLGSSDFKVCAVDLSEAKPEVKDVHGEHLSYVTGVALSGTTLVSGAYDGKLVWWDIAANKLIRTTKDAHAKWIRKLAASPDGSRIASIADDMVCRLWDASTGKLVSELRGHQEKTPHGYGSMLYAVAFSPDGTLIVTGDKVGHVVVWDAKKGTQLASVEAPVMYTWDPVQRLHSIGGIRSVAISPDNATLAVGGMGKVGNIDHLEGKTRLELFDWKAGKALAEIQSDKFKGLVNRLAFAPDGSWLAGAGGAGEGFLSFWDVKQKKVIREEKVGNHIHDFAMSKAGSEIALVGHSKVIVFQVA